MCERKDSLLALSRFGSGNTRMCWHLDVVFGEQGGIRVDLKILRVGDGCDERVDGGQRQGSEAIDGRAHVDVFVDVWSSVWQLRLDLRGCDSDTKSPANPNNSSTTARVSTTCETFRSPSSQPTSCSFARCECRLHHIIHD